MKIGILTQPLHTNYGGLLQNYALQQVLIEAGHKVETIDWNGTKTLRSRLSRVKMVVKSILFFGSGKKKYSPTSRELSIICRNTNDFINKYIYHTSPMYSMSDFKTQSVVGEYNAYIVGSDQCWRPKFNRFLSAMFFSFIKDRQVKRIAYAASFGTDDWEFSSKLTKECSQLAQKIDLITVREDSGVNLCKRYLDVDAIQVLDPTMLLTMEDYIHLIDKENEPQSSGSLFNYILDPNEHKTKFIDIVSKELKLKSFSVLPKCQVENRTKHDVKNHIEDCVFPGVFTWLRAFKDAEMTIVDSFHGMVFSIIFNKPFWVIGNNERGMSRFVSLLKMFELEDRLISLGNENNVDLTQPIDWSKVNNILNAKRIESKSILLNSLK